MLICEELSSSGGMEERKGGKGRRGRRREKESVGEEKKSVPANPAPSLHVGKG